MRSGLRLENAPSTLLGCYITVPSRVVSVETVGLHKDVIYLCQVMSHLWRW